MSIPLSIIDAAIAKKEGAGGGDVGRGHRTARQTRMPLEDFIRGAWHVLEGRRLFLPNWHIDALSQHLTAVSDGLIPKLVVTMPPGMLKSLATSVFWPAWDWGPNARPDRRWLCLSFGGDTASPANRDAEKCRDLLLSEWYQRQWGPTFALSETQNAKSFYKNDAGGYRVSTGIEGQASGQRADVVLIDDPTKLDEDSMQSILRPQDVYERTLMHRAIDDGSAFVLIMQRLHPEDLAGYFLKQDGWAHLNLPMFYETGSKCRVFIGPTLFWEDPRSREGQPLHPRMTTAIQTAELQRVLSIEHFEAQQQQRPSLREGQIIKRIDRFGTGTDNPLPTDFDEIIITVDCAFKGERLPGEVKGERSYVVFQKWARKHANAYLLDQLRKHMELPETLTTLVEFCTREPFATAKYVEAKANGVGVVQMLKNALPGLISTDDDEDVMKPFCSGSKEAKLQSVAPFFMAGNVKIPTAAWLNEQGYVDWTGDYVYELTRFPKTRFNDQVDATSMGVWRLLYTFQGHISLASVADAGMDRGVLVGLFGGIEDGPNVGLGIGDMAKGAYGSNSLGLADMIRGAYGQ